MDKYERRRLRLLSLRDEQCGGSGADLARRIDRDRQADVGEQAVPDDQSWASGKRAEAERRLESEELGNSRCEGAKKQEASR